MSLQTLVAGLLYGVKDSLLGGWLVLTIDQDERTQENSAEDVKDGGGDRPPSRRSRRTPKDHGRVLPMLAQCCLLNGGVFLLSILLFEYYFLPLMQMVAHFFYALFVSSDEGQNYAWSWMEPVLSYTFNFLWVVPLFWLSKLLNSVWFLEIADVAYRKKLGRPVAFLAMASKKESFFKSLSKLMADFLFTLHVEILFLVQARLVGLIPVVGPLLSFLHLCLLYSLYAFEYTWLNLGWNIMRRVACIENNWPYFVGFGLPLTALSGCLSSSFVISACVFGVLFPVFILSGLEAKPTDSGHSLKIFSAVIWITNKVFVKSRFTNSSSNPE